MRKIVDTQLKLEEVDIADIRFDLRSRDEIPKLLMGLQSIYCNPVIRQQVFEVLTSIIPKNVDPNNGRRGMDLWRILVLGTLRLCCSWDYDKLHEMTNNHDKLRKMLGHSEMDKDYRYPQLTLKDNVSLLTSPVVASDLHLNLRNTQDIPVAKKLVFLELA